MIENSAVFVGGHRKFKNVNVDVGPEIIIVRNRLNGDEITRYSVVEVAKADMAWDISQPSHESDTRTRLVVQQGCGCSGMFPYDEDAGYSGVLTPRRR